MAALAGRPPEIADLLRNYAPPLDRLGPDRRRAVRDITSCRTPALGGHLHRCDKCGHQVPLYNSCRNRHCPKCQNLAQVRWVEQRTGELLPVPYFHVVFTVPACLHPLFLSDRRQSFARLFAAAWDTLNEVCRRRLGATPGAIAILHTWSQTLAFHPHIHFIVTGGGLDASAQRWITTRRPNYFLPVRVLSRVFRGKLVHALEPSSTSSPAHSDLLRQAVAQPWVVYCKPPMAGPQQVLRYLGRYTHRIAIGNERVLSLDQGQVRFRYRDRRHRNTPKVLTLSGAEFVRRFLLHVLPKRFVRLRHFGLFANPYRNTRIADIRTALAQPTTPQPTKIPPESWQDLYRRLTGRAPDQCPLCAQGTLRLVLTLPPAPPLAASRAP